MSGTAIDEVVAPGPMVVRVGPDVVDVVGATVVVGAAVVGGALVVVAGAVVVVAGTVVAGVVAGAVPGLVAGAVAGVVADVVADVIPEGLASGPPGAVVGTGEPAVLVVVSRLVEVVGASGGAVEVRLGHPTTATAMTAPQMTTTAALAQRAGSRRASGPGKRASHISHRLISRPARPRRRPRWRPTAGAPGARAGAEAR